MDVEGNASVPVIIEPKHVYGIRPEVIGNIHFNFNQEVIYPVEGVLAFHDYVKNKQAFLKLPANTAPAIIALNSTRLLMAVVEITSNEDDNRLVNIVVYDLLAFKKQRTFQLPSRARHKRITQISFTCDSKALVVLTNYPDEMLYMFFFDKIGTIVEGRAGNTNRHGIANCICCNPQNPGLVAVCGDGVMKLMTKSEKAFSINGDTKPDFNATSIAWISSEKLIIGTNNGMLVLFEKSIRKSSFQAKEVEIIDLTADLETEDQSLLEAPPAPGVMTKSEAIVCMTAFAKGLAFAIFNLVYVFERVSKTKYERKTILEIPAVNYEENLYQITNMAINLKQDTVIVTPKHNQIYVGVLIVPESLKTEKLEFTTLGELIHIDEILDICVCSWRPIVVSSSKDKTIRIWNYQTEKVELVKRFPIEITVIELYASGQYAAIGFIDKVKIMQIFMDDLNLIKAYNFPNAKDIKFSHLGHLMATAYESSVAITSVFNLENLKTFKGHTGNVLTVAWARNDKSVISGGCDGALYQWDIETGDKLQEIIHPGTEYHALCVPSDTECFFAATNSGALKEIKNSQVVREINMPFKSPLLDIAMTKSDSILFAATSGGHLYNIHLPLTEGSSEAYTKYSFFDSAITKLRFSFDGTLLISSSSSGTLAIWELRNIKGKVAPIDQDLLKSHEVLIPRKELEEKTNRIKELEIQLKQQAAEFYKKQSQHEESDQQQMADTHKGYCEALNELKAKNDEITVRHAEELTQITSQIDELNLEHKTHMDTMSAQYSERMLMEYQKFSNLRESMLKIRDSYEEKLTKSDGCLLETVKALELDFKRQLDERQELIRQLMKEMEDKKLEFTEYCRQVEVDNDRKLIDCQIGYEKKVKFERDETDKWKDQADTYQLKYDVVRKESANLLEEVAKLKDQHYKSKAIIAELNGDIKDLHRDVADREEAITVKEKRIDEIILKNQELEKYRLVLNHKINELKAQIEPRELQIVEKRKQITEMEQELNGLQKNNLQLELKMKELKDKCLSANVELKMEYARAKSARLCITDICTEIYQVAHNSDYTDRLKDGIKYLFHKYSNDDALKKFVTLDTQVQADLHKQRGHIEKILLGCKQKMQMKSNVGKSKKLVEENAILLEEVHEIRRQNESVQEEIKNMTILVKIVTTTKSKDETKSTDNVVETERINKFFEERVTNLEMKAKRLIDENHRLSEEVDKKRNVSYKTATRDHIIN